ncbi:MAG: ABC transporter ATP-binding protein [Chloroflexi bacterium]|nr:ABC transporter ATP-binding protein [Chloroflexota bacterium]
MSPRSNPLCRSVRVASAQQYDIVVEALVKRYGQLEAVRGVSFSVARGEVFGILGPNGAGKTTTLECIEGLHAPTSGRTLVLGLDTARDPVTVKQRIGVQLHATSYFDYLTLIELLDLFGRFYPKRRKPMDLLALVGLEHKAKATVNNLSGGEKQRFSVAATLVNDPEVVFLDEPTTGLDPKARRDLWSLVEHIHAEGHTIVLTTHYMDEAQALCGRVAIMHQGKIVALDTPQNLVLSLPAPYEIRFEVNGHAQPNAFAALDSVANVEAGAGGSYTLQSKDAARTLPALLAWASGANTHLERLQVKPATLEDVFLALTGQPLPGHVT